MLLEYITSVYRNVKKRLSADTASKALANTGKADGLAKAEASLRRPRDPRAFGIRLNVTLGLYKQIHSKRKQDEQEQGAIVFEANIRNEELSSVLIEALRKIKNFEKLIIAGFEAIEQYRFSTFSSVQSKYLKSNSDKTQNRFDYLQANINLETHTLNVVRATLELPDSEIQQFERELLIMLAIFHDFGKCTAIRELLNVKLKELGKKTDAFEHEHYGAWFMHFLFLKNYPTEGQLSEKLREVICAQHGFRGDSILAVDQNLLRLLKEVDAAARTKELEGYNGTE